MGVFYLEDASFWDQAQAYSTATVLIWNFGKPMANLIFLPMGATAIQTTRRGDYENIRVRHLCDGPLLSASGFDG